MWQADRERYPILILVPFVLLCFMFFFCLIKKKNRNNGERGSETADSIVVSAASTFESSRDVARVGASGFGFDTPWRVMMNEPWTRTRSDGMLSRLARAVSEPLNS